MKKYYCYYLTVSLISHIGGNSSYSSYPFIAHNHNFSWTLRIVCGLIMATSLSLRASRVMTLERFKPHDYTWYFALSLINLGSSVLGFLG